MNRFDSSSQRTFLAKKKNWIAYFCLKIKVDSKWNISQILTIILERNYMSLVKSIGNAFFCCTNLKMFFHIFIILGKNILTVVTLLNSTITNTFSSFLKSTYVGSVSKMNLIGQKTRKRNLFNINSLISNIYGNKLFSLQASWCFIISWTLNFSSTQLERFLVTWFFPSTFLLYLEPKNISSFKEF